MRGILCNSLGNVNATNMKQIDQKLSLFQPKKSILLSFKISGYHSKNYEKNIMSYLKTGYITYIFYGLAPRNLHI